MDPRLEHAAKAGDTTLLEERLRSGVGVDSLDGQGQTALMLAAHNGRLEAVECLIRYKADLDVTAKYGLSALMLAIVAGHEAVACALVRAGADLTRRGSGAPGFAGKTAYDLARKRGMAQLCAEIAARDGRES